MTPLVSPAALLLGFDRDLLGGAVPLPINLALIAMPDCFLLHDLIPPTLNTNTDGTGCAQGNLLLPLDPFLRGRRVYLSWPRCTAGSQRR